LIQLAQRLGFRSSEWVLIAFFAYIAAIAPFFRDRPHLGYEPLALLLVVFGLLWILAKAEQTAPAHWISIARDWLPIALTFVAFREMEFFLPPHFEHRYEAVWIRQDQRLLETWHVRALIESVGKVIPYYLELCYLLVYAVAQFCVALLYIEGLRQYVDRFLLVFLIGTLGSYALFPYFPSEPPRFAFPGVDNPSYITLLHRLNVFILAKGTIHVGVFPSAHVSSAFSAAWALFWLLPRRPAFGWSLLVYAISVSIATVYGRYHYFADVLAGFGVSLVAAGLCLYLRRSASRVVEYSSSKATAREG
jgi:membrane-associated phospholipid phosphatase